MQYITFAIIALVAIVVIGGLVLLFKVIEKSPE